MRTRQQVVARIQLLNDGDKNFQDFLAFEREVLYTYLDFESAKQFLKNGAEKEQWEIDGIPLSLAEAAIKADLESYLAFAWDKAVHHRGLSASRSIDKIKAWLWLLEEDELLAKIENREIPFAQYGAPILYAVSTKYGFYYPTWEEAANMIVGRKCRADCAEGCGT